MVVSLLGRRWRRSPLGRRPRERLGRRRVVGDGGDAIDVSCTCGDGTDEQEGREMLNSIQLIETMSAEANESKRGFKGLDLAVKVLRENDISEEALREFACIGLVALYTEPDTRWRDHEEALARFGDVRAGKYTLNDLHQWTGGMEQ
jgi:hypothetical protein